ncbi:TRAP transporter small permease [Candidatus Atribacteria bacterium 1244-E10-H5-B2]|nr:MAG: TRAP transporter small permease [Candidatus Atribacteria bacterium 1244-E10-H5-B2]
MEAPGVKKIVYLKGSFQNFVYQLDNVTEIILWIGVSLILFAVVFHVIGRYFFGKTYMGTMELIRYTMIWTSMLGASNAFTSGEHIGMELLKNKVSKRTWWWISILANVLLCIFLIAMLIGGTKLSFINWNQISLGMQIPMFYPYLAIPVGALFMFFHVLLDILNTITSNKFI